MQYRKRMLGYKELIRKSEAEAKAEKERKKVYSNHLNTVAARNPSSEYRTTIKI